MASGRIEALGLMVERMLDVAISASILVASMKPLENAEDFLVVLRSDTDTVVRNGNCHIRPWRCAYAAHHPQQIR